MESGRKNTRQILFIVTFAILLYSVVQNLAPVSAGLRYALGLISPITGGLCLAFVLNIPTQSIEKHLFGFLPRLHPRWGAPWARALAILSTVLLLTGLALVFALFILPEVTGTVYVLLARLPSAFNRVMGTLRQTLESMQVPEAYIPDWTIDWQKITEVVSDFLTNRIGSVFSVATSVTGSVVGRLFDVIMVCVMALYALAQKEKLIGMSRRVLTAFLPRKVSTTIMKVASLSGVSFTNFVAGQVTEALILGALCFVGMLIFRFPYALIISSIVCVTAMVPMIGAWISAIVGGLLIMTVDFGQAFLFVLFLIVLQQIEGNAIYPKVVGRSVGLPGILVLAAVIIGGNIAGILGILLSVPICSVLLVLLREALSLREHGADARGAFATAFGNDADVGAAGSANRADSRAADSANKANSRAADTANRADSRAADSANRADSRAVGFGNRSEADAGIPGASASGAVPTPDARAAKATPKNAPQKNRPRKRG